MNRNTVSFFVLLFVLFSLFPTLPVCAISGFNDGAFDKVWNRIDKPVEEFPLSGRGYTWGPVVQEAQGITREGYNGGTRTVQYFDKARMEVNNPDANANDLFYVTTGLLVKELVTGYRQDGDNQYAIFAPSQVQVVGDPNDGNSNTIAPTYASFASVITTQGSDKAKPSAIGSLVTSRIDRAGQVSEFSPPAQVTIAAYDSLTYHNVANVFVEYANKVGTIWNGASFEQGALFFGNPTYVLGRPVTDPLWTRAIVAGSEKDVLVQLFERRVLTYTPDNPEGFKVEMGNVGQHYYRWRYQLNNPYPAVPTKFERLNEFGKDYNALQYPAYIAIDSHGYTYVGDYSNRIIKYDNAGHPQVQFGGTGTQDRQFTSLLGLSIDTQDNLYAVDSSWQNIQKFDAQGHFLLKWGSAGSGNGQFNSPRSVVTDAQNNVYVLDSSRVQKFDGNGHFLGAWSNKGPSDSQFNTSVQLATDEQGNLYVLDLNSQSHVALIYIKKFDAQGHFLLKWEAGVSNTVPGFVYEGQGHLLVGLDRYDTNGKLLEHLGSNLTDPQDGSSPRVNRVAEDRQGQIYFTDGERAWVYKLDRQGKLISYFSTYGREDGQFRRPGGVAVDSAGNLFVFDTGNFRVQKFDSQGNFLLKWGNAGSGDGQFGGVGSLAVDGIGNVYVADAVNHRIQKFDGQGHFLFKWGNEPVGNADCQGTLAFPNSVAVDKSGVVYVLDGQIKCIEKFDAEGHFLQLWGGLGSTNGSLLSSNNIALDRDGHLYFTDEENNRILKTDLFFKPLLQWGENGDNPGQFNRPHAITTDNQGNLYIFNNGNLYMDKFDGAGNFLSRWTYSADLNGNFKAVSGAAVDGQGNLYIVDVVNDRISKFRQS